MFTIQYFIKNYLALQHQKFKLKTKMTKLNILFIAVVLAFATTSCTNINKTLREPNVRVKLLKSDFTLSEQVSGEATSTKILCIDWDRLFKNTTGTVEGGGASSMISLANLPVIGNLMHDKTANLALYEMMEKNQGYDVIFYPQYETTVKRPIGLGFIYKITTVKTRARLGKLNQ